MAHSFKFNIVYDVKENVKMLPVGTKGFNASLPVF